jgi:FAD binding domain
MMNWFRTLLERLRFSRQRRPVPSVEQTSTDQASHYDARLATLPKFKGPVYLRDGSEEYAAHAYQYATTSQAEGTMAPSAIVYVADDDDIALAIRYARENDLGVAVRSGGHQYIGASSTSGNNIQIDLSGREAPDRSTYPYRQWAVDADEGSVSLGAALDVDDVCSIELAHEFFFPHGECCGVHIGGHSQTGGWSLLTRSFGLMIDHLLRFDIILADGTKRTVERDSQDSIDKDLWFAVLGGSPGNLGVVTRITVKYLKDTDYPKARGFKMAWFFRQATLQRMVQIINEINDDPNGDPDFALTVFALGEEYDPAIPSFLPETFDNEMMKKHPNLVGKDKFHWVVPTIVVVGAWTNSRGADQDDSMVEAVFERFTQVPGMLDLKLLNLVFPGDFMDGKERTPLSKIMKALTFENPREFNMSCKKLLWFGKNTRTMSQKNELGVTFAEWVSNKVYEVERLKNEFKFYGMKAAVQVGMIGGPGLANAPIATAMGQRDGNYWLAFDIFYDPGVPGTLEKTTTFTNALAADVMSNKLNFWDDNRERRVMLGPTLVNDEKPILDDLWALFYDNREVYERLLRIKQELDPHHVFTANLFGVGATSCQRFAAALTHGRPYDPLSKEPTPGGSACLP